ncbi:unnamed protein product [Agarophyton chilense]
MAFVSPVPLRLGRPRGCVRRVRSASSRCVSASAAADDAPSLSETLCTTDWRAFRAQLAVNQRLRCQPPPHHAALATAAVAAAHWAHTQPHVERGAVLLAAPDHHWQPAFAHLKRSVILLTDVSAGDVRGLLLNRRTRYSVRQQRSVLARVGACFGDNALYLGGDCSTGSLEMLHAQPPTLCAGAAEVVPGVYRGGFNASRGLVAAGTLPPHAFRFLVAYSQWTRATLRAELQRGAWIIVSCSPSLLLHAHTPTLWRTIMRLISSS